MKQCSNCGNFTWNNGFTPMPDICVDCKFIEVGDDVEPCNWKPKSMTFGDKLRSMSDEQYAEFFADFAAQQRNIIFRKLQEAGISIDVEIVEIPMMKKAAHLAWIKSLVGEGKKE